MPYSILRLAILPCIALLAVPFMARCEDAAPRIEKPFSSEASGMDPAPERNFIRIATWKIEWFPAGLRHGADENAQLQTAATAALIREFDPDILVTQETRNLRALVLLNNNLGSRGYSRLASSWYYGENLEQNLNDKIQQQCGILSRFPWSEIWELDFAPFKTANPPVRGWLAARFNIKGRQFVLYNAFLKSNTGVDNAETLKANAASREASIRELKRDLDRLNLDPYRDRIIVLGDFNTDYFDSRFQGENTFGKLASMGFQHTWGAESRQNIITYPAAAGDARPDEVYDYIWLSSACGDPAPQAKVLAKGASKRKGVFGGDEPGLASDHYPVWVDIPLK